MGIVNNLELTNHLMKNSDQEQIDAIAKEIEALGWQHEERRRAFIFSVVAWKTTLAEDGVTILEKVSTVEYVGDIDKPGQRLMGWQQILGDIKEHNVQQLAPLSLPEVRELPRRSRENNENNGDNEVIDATF